MIKANVKNSERSQKTPRSKFMRYPVNINQKLKSTLYMYRVGRDKCKIYLRGESVSILGIRFSSSTTLTARTTLNDSEVKF